MTLEGWFELQSQSLRRSVYSGHPNFQLVDLTWLVRAGLGSGGGFERLHFLLEKAWDGDEISLSFMKVHPTPTFIGLTTV